MEIQMKPKLIFALSGKIGSGKDTAAAVIAEYFKLYNLPTERHAFADKLRESIELITEYKMTIDKDLPFANVVKNYSQEDKNVMLPEWGMTIGQMLQIYGTECMRNHFHSETWVLSCLARIKNVEGIVVIPDLRFKNEANALKEVGGILIRLEGDPANVRANSKRDLNHQSEIDLDDYNGFDFRVQTTPQLRTLKANMANIIAEKSKLWL